MNRHQRIVASLQDQTQDLIARCLARPTEVEVWGNLIGCANGVPAHVDPEHVFDPWSAFYVLHNDDCIVWGDGLRIRPHEGQRFELNINLRHGVLARKHGHQVFVAMLADGLTRRAAKSRLAAMLRSY